jgi:hypothetical protein
MEEGIVVQRVAGLRSWLAGDECRLRRINVVVLDDDDGVGIQPGLVQRRAELDAPQDSNRALDQRCNVLVRRQDLPQRRL